MEFSVKNKNSIVDLSRKIGYVIIDTNERGEYNMVRRLQFGNYPRFHVYLKLQNDNYIFSLHLDQKKPIYGAKGPARNAYGIAVAGGVHAHNGEYFGPVVDDEADRIKQILQ